MDVEELEISVGSAAKLMRSLASEKRLLLLCHLVEGERSVGELCDSLGISQANASQQLALLRRDRLVRTRRDAQTIYYSLASGEARRVIEVLYELYCCAPTSAKKVSRGRKRPPRREGRHDN